MRRTSLALAAVITLGGCAPASFAPTATIPGAQSSSAPSVTASATATESTAVTETAASTPSATEESSEEPVSTLEIPAPTENEVARMSFGDGKVFSGSGIVQAGSYTVEVGCDGPYDLGFRISLDGTMVNQATVSCDGGVVDYVEAFEAVGGEELSVDQLGDYPENLPGYIRVLHNG